MTVQVSRRIEHPKAPTAGRPSRRDSCCCAPLISLISSRKPVGWPLCCAKAASALTSRGRHGPPKGGPARRYLPPMRLSSASALVMASISAPSIREQIWERKFAKLILTVRKLFRANFAISALTNDMRWTGGLLRTTRRRILSTSAPAAGCDSPIRIRSGRSKSATTEPERDKFGIVADRHGLPDRLLQDSLYDWNNRSGNRAGRNRASDDDQKSLLVLRADRAAKVCESLSKRARIEAAIGTAGRRQ